MKSAFNIFQHFLSHFKLANKKILTTKNCIEGGEDKDIKGLQYFDTHFYGGGKKEN